LDKQSNVFEAILVDSYADKTWTNVSIKNDMRSRYSNQGLCSEQIN